MAEQYWTSPWLLLVLLLVVWYLGGLGSAAEADLENAQKGVPDHKRGGVSILPIFPLFPLAFWGLALLIDRFTGSWGTLVVGGIHVVLGVVWTVLIYRYRKRLAEIEESDRP